MPQNDPGWISRRGALLLAVCGLACLTAVAMMIREWRAAVAPVAPVAAQAGDRARPPGSFGEAQTPSAGRAKPTDTMRTPPPPSRRHHRRGNRVPAELAGVSLEPVAAQLAAELSSVRPQLEACTRVGAGDSNAAATAAAARAVQNTALQADDPSLSAEQKALLRDLGAAAVAGGREAMPKSLRLEVETGDDEVRIVTVLAPDDGSFYRCADRTLKGRTVASPGATAGRRTSVILPL